MFGVEVLWSDLIEELAKLLDLFFLVVGNCQAGLVQYVFATDDPAAGAQCQCDGVGGRALTSTPSPSTNTA